MSFYQPYQSSLPTSSAYDRPDASGMFSSRSMNDPVAFAMAKGFFTSYPSDDVGDNSWPSDWNWDVKNKKLLPISARALSVNILKPFYSDMSWAEGKPITVSSDFPVLLLSEELIYAHERWPEWVDRLYQLGVYNEQLEFLAKRNPEAKKRYDEWKARQK